MPSSYRLTPGGVEFLFIRHAEAGWLEDGTAIEEPRLTDRGFAQARHLATRLVPRSGQAYLVSPMTRAIQTAATALPQAPWHEADWLGEIRFPRWSAGCTVDIESVLARSMVSPTANEWSTAGGEPSWEFSARVRTGLVGYLEQLGVRKVSPGLWTAPQREASTIAVCHAGSISLALAELLGLAATSWDRMRFQVGYCSITRVVGVQVEDQMAFSVFELGDLAHIPEALRLR
jgi:broad specificity phosphatase PhoE